MERIAIVRDVSPNINRCEITHIERQRIDVPQARAQHQAYVDALRHFGVRVLALPAEADYPDSVFVEDVAVVLPEAAIITLPGADSRKGERASIAAALRPYRTLFFIEAPAALDGGDVLVLDKEIYVGLSTRSNKAAIDQMQEFLAPWGYRVHGVEVKGCLHLKSAVTQVGERLLLLNPDWVDERLFDGFTALHVHPAEPYAANGLWLGDVVIYPTAYPATAARLQAHGVHLQQVNVSELAKAEGAVTCCSLIFQT